MRVISACLLGVGCRYDGGHRLHPAALRLCGSECLIPVCPEQLGGLPTPRTAVEVVGGDGADVIAGRARVIDREGHDVTAAFLRGANETLGLCERLAVRGAILKARSPSCGVGLIYRGPKLVRGDGVTAALLQQRGIRTECHPD